MLKISAIIVAGIIISSCANIGAPTGGPKDIDPPKVTKSVPPNKSLNYKAKTARIYFNEFIKLKNVSSQLIVSPPLDDLPELKIKGKSIVVEFQEDLKDSTTYTVYFGEAIVDITEDNPISNFQFVLSTGNTIDSLSIGGTVYNAFTRDPEKDIYVMLYNNSYDSVPMKERPYYLSKTGENGEFNIENLKGGGYKIFAVKDANSNYLYDLPNEQIAFLDSLVIPEYIPKPKSPDTSKADSITPDTIQLKPPKRINRYDLFLFEEIDSTQKVVKSWMLNKGLLRFAFKYPVKDAEIDVLEHKFGHDWKIIEYNKTRDTLTLWLKDVSPDTIALIISEKGVALDTVTFTLAIKTRSTRRSKKRVEKLKIRTNAYGKFDINKPAVISFESPVKKYDFSRILLIEGADTLSPTTFFIDSIKRKAIIPFKWKEKTSYEILIPDSIFTDIFDLSNDTLIQKFTTKELSDYGTFQVNIKLGEQGWQYIIQLLNEKDVIINETIIDKDREILYEYLYPKEYKIKAILDLNRNSRWDTGIYLENLQPELVFFYPKTIKIRANWENEEDWVIGE